MGLSLGLHVESNKFSATEKYLRRRIWWSMAWQDSHFSLSYDRPSTMAFSQPDIPYGAESTVGERQFFETLCGMLSLVLGILRSRMLAPRSQMSLDAIKAYKERIRSVINKATPYLRDPQFCQVTSQHLERLALKLHSSYVISELCRPALKPDSDMNDPTIAELRKDCINALSKTVESYTEIHAVNPRAARSWIGIQRAISCGFLLAVLKESKSDPKIIQLLRQLEQVVADRVAEEGNYDQGTTPNTTSSSAPTMSPQGIGSYIDGVTNIYVPPLDPSVVGHVEPVPATLSADTRTQWSKPLAKSLKALQKLNTVLAANSSQGFVSSKPLSNPPELNPNAGTAQSLSPAIGSSVPIKRSGSLPPPTPESSSSGEWNYPNLLDRASEYIHPPLWS